MFTPKTLSFLRSLKRNNKREWFHERARSIRAALPAADDGDRRAARRDHFRSFAPEMLADPKVCLLRQFRDTVSAKTRRR